MATVEHLIGDGGPAEKRDGFATLLRRSFVRAVAPPMLDRRSRWRIAGSPTADWFLAG